MAQTRSGAGSRASEACERRAAINNERRDRELAAHRLLFLGRVNSLRPEIVLDISDPNNSAPSCSAEISSTNRLFRTFRPNISAGRFVRVRKIEYNLWPKSYSSADSDDISGILHTSAKYARPLISTPLSAN